MQYLTYILFMLSSVNSFNLQFTRRSFLGATVLNKDTIFSNNNPFKLPELTFNITKINELNEIKRIKNENNRIDPYSHWSFYGNVQPPIKKVLSYQELLEEIHNNTIYTIQIAPQHDSIIATNYQGYRYSSQVKDENFNKLIEDSLDENNNLPFIVLPIDQNKQKVRKLAQYIFYESLIFYILADLDIIDFDTNFYPSWNDRQKANKSNKKSTKFLKSLLDKLSEKNNTNS